MACLFLFLFFFSLTSSVPPSAIDNATRGLLALDPPQLSVLCGLWFSLGHSTIVIVVVCRASRPHAPPFSSHCAAERRYRRERPHLRQARRGRRRRRHSRSVPSLKAPAPRAARHPGANFQFPAFAAPVLFACLLAPHLNTGAITTIWISLALDAGAVCGAWPCASYPADTPREHFISGRPCPSAFISGRCKNALFQVPRFCHRCMPHTGNQILDSLGTIWLRRVVFSSATIGCGEGGGGHCPRCKSHTVDQILDSLGKIWLPPPATSCWGTFSSPQPRVGRVLRCKTRSFKVLSAIAAYRIQLIRFSTRSGRYWPLGNIFPRHNRVCDVFFLLFAGHFQRRRDSFAHRVPHGPPHSPHPSYARKSILRPCAR